MEAGSVANGSTPTSADACMSIVHSLSCHRQGGKSIICLQFRISKKARKILKKSSTSFEINLVDNKSSVRFRQIFCGPLRKLELYIRIVTAALPELLAFSGNQGSASLCA